MLCTVQCTHHNDNNKNANCMSVLSSYFVQKNNIHWAMKEKAYRNAKKRKYYKFMCIMKKETKVKTTSPPALWIPNAVEIKKK